MPYFVFAVKPFAQLEKLGEFEVFKEASARAKVLRAELPADANVRIKVMFAEDQLSAEDLVNQLRTSVRIGDDE